MRNKFTKRWIGPCRIIRLVGRAAAQLQLPSTLSELKIHDVFHFSVLKPYHEAFELDSDPNPQPQPETGPSSLFEVESIVDYDKGRPLSTYPFTKAPHYRVHWKGYQSSEDTWLPLPDLSSCLEAIADYLFCATSARRREKLIAEFPRRSRDKLTQLLANAEQTRRQHVPSDPRRARGPNTHY